MTIKFCEVEGCHDVAVGVSRWDPEKKPESRFCRDDYLSQAQLVQCEVVGELEVTDAVTNTGVGKGGTVTLDVLQTNIAQLVYAGHVKVPQAEKKPKPQAPASPPVGQSTKD